MNSHVWLSNLVGFDETTQKQTGNYKMKKDNTYVMSNYL